MSGLVILDRDGVINQDSDAYVKSVDEWIPIPGSAEAIARLSQAGIQVVVATNQSGLARGYFTLDGLTAMHRKMEALITAAGGELAGIFFCPHGPEDDCPCRKPRPGLIHQIEQTLGRSAQGAYLVGDSLRDLQAGQQVGCQPILVLTGKGQCTLARGEGLSGVTVVADLAAAAEHILNQRFT